MKIFYTTSTKYLAFYREKIVFQPHEELPPADSSESASTAFQTPGERINVSQLQGTSFFTRRELVCVQHYFFLIIFLSFDQLNPV